MLAPCILKDFLQSCCYLFSLLAVELRSEIVAANIVSGVELEAQIEAAAIVQVKDMFKFSFSAAVLAENMDAVTAAIAVEMAKREGLYYEY